MKAETIGKLYEDMKISDVTQIYKQGMAGWTRASEVVELEEVIKNASKALKAKTGDKKEIVAPFDHTEDTAGAAGAGTAAVAGTPTENDKKKKKKRKNPKWKERKDHANVYVTGLPSDITVTEMHDYFKKCGVLAMDMEKEQPRVKLYGKGDGLVCYAKPASVPLAIQYLDDSEIRVGCKISVQKAEFKMKGEKFVAKEKKEGENKVKKFKLNQNKLLSWNDEGEDEDGLRIVILKHMFSLEEAQDNEEFYNELKLEIGIECEKQAGPIEKLTVFEGSEVGAVAVKFKDSISATKCIEVMDGRFFGGMKVECDYWDGVTNYKKMDTEEDEQKRLSEFGDWLEQGPAPEIK